MLSQSNTLKRIADIESKLDYLGEVVYRLERRMDTVEALCSVRDKGRLQSS